jgi:hypothetical protein
MKVNGIIRILGITCLVMVMVSCASSSKKETAAPTGTIAGTGTNAPAAASNIRREIIDSKGWAISGSEVPAWVQSVIDSDLNALQKLPELEGKIAVVGYGIGQNLDLLRSQVDNFDVQSSVARRISNYVEANFGSEQLGDKNSAENRSFIKEVVTTVSQVKIYGLAKEKDYWVKLRTTDREKKTETEQIYYYAFFSIPEQLLNEQVTRAMNNVPAKTRDQEEIRTDVEAAMKQAALNSIEAAS